MVKSFLLTESRSRGPKKGSGTRDEGQTSDLSRCFQAPKSDRAEWRCRFLTSQRQLSIKMEVEREIDRERLLAENGTMRRLDVRMLNYITWLVMAFTVQSCTGIRTDTTGPITTQAISEPPGAEPTSRIPTERVICPECAKLGLKSTVTFTGVGSTTNVPWAPITYDENGVPTYHKNPNKTNWACYCSKGHAFYLVK